jgi:AcrR family transcriptional regulator
MRERLVNATIEHIGEAGLHATTVRSVASRAGVSQGAIFAHFASRTALLVETCHEVSRRQLEQIATADLGAGGDLVGAVVNLARSICRSTTNVIWYELLSAARTDAALRAATIDVLAHHSRATRETAIAAFSLVHPELDHDDARALVVAALAMFDGEAIVNLVNPTPEFDELVERALRVVAGLLAEHATTRIATGQPSSRVEAAGTAAETLGRSV